MAQTNGNNDQGTSGSTFSVLQTLQREPLYRPAKPLSYEIRNHSAVFLEDGQYFEGFSFLDSLLVAGTSISTPDKPYPALIAPPQQLALASSLVVYPPITTKAKSADRQKGADAALRYLRNLRSTINPLTEGFMPSFTFAIENAKRRYRSVGSSSDDDNEDRERLNCLAATSESLWTRAEDFWHVVGWAFNCSVEHKKRWERWKLWLAAMLDLVEAEWEERVRLYNEDSTKDDSILTASLLWRYIASQDPQSRATRRRILRAILATGTNQSKKEFPEVWHNETVERKVEDNISGPRKIDISKDDFGEYGGDEEYEAIEGTLKVPTRGSRRIPWKNLPSTLDDEGEEDEGELIHGPEHAVEKLGGTDAIYSRQRLLSLLVQVAEHLPKEFIPVDDIYDSITEFFRPLPTIIFSIFLSTSQLPSSSQIALNANILLPLVSTQLPNYSVISPTQADFEKYILPCRAATHSYAANAKTAFVLESLFQLLMEIGSLKATKSLRKAVEAGINARDIPYGSASRKKGNEHEEEQAKELMELSNERLLGLLDILEISAGKPTHMRNTSDDLLMTSSLSSVMTMSSESEMDTESE